MSYNNYHKPSVPSGISRGRGFSTRGSFRSRGDSSGSWSSSSRGRGFTGPSRGRFNWYKDHSTGFDSRTRYTSGVTGGVERYSSRGRGGDDSGYRRYSRADVPEYTSRDHSHHRSPDSQRKRMRTEHGYVQASSTRRSHDGSYGGGADYNSRYSYSEDKGGYGEERGRGYRDERRSVGSFRDRSREDYPHRKPDQMDSSMPPPSGLPPRHLASPRGSFRGRISRGMRGMSRIMLSRRADTFLARKRPMMDSYTVRKRILTSRATPAETLRRLKIQRLRRLREAAAAAKEEGKEKDGTGTKATEDISDDDDDEKDDAWDEDVEKADDEELEEGETPDKKKVKKVKKSPKVPKDEEPEEGEDIDDDEDDDDDDDDEAKKSAVKNGVHVTIKQDSDARAVSEEFRNQRTNFRGRRFIRLSCPHCFTRCITFKEYENHLYLTRHISAMRKQSFRHKQTLARMRMTQRHKQRIVEAEEESQGTLSLRTKFCLICKLNYRQLRSNHLISEYHRKMKKFLMPYCRVCDIGFKSPMLFENHISSLDHIKRKAYMEEGIKHMHERAREEEGSGIDEDDKDLNLDNFMILDSVGTVDDAGEDADSDGEGKGKDKEKVEGEDKKKLGSEIKLGSEYVKKVEVYYCELCRMYLPRLEIAEKALAIHCRTRTHLQRYVRYRDDRALRRKAERIHRKEIAKENAEKDPDAKKKDDDKMDEDGTEKDGTKGSDEAAGKVTIKREGGSELSQGESRTADLSTETAGEARADGDNQDGDVDLDQDLEAGMDDKLWADVDKDLGELLREVEPGNKSSDEDDDSRAEGGRYDRFRYSEKGSVATTDPPSEGDAGDAVKTNAEPAGADAADSSKDVKKTVDSKAEGEATTKKSSGNAAAAATPTTTATI